MNAPLQPDIEIYVKDATVDTLVDWLHKRLGKITAEPSRGRMQHFTAERDGTTIPVRIMTGVVGKVWTCVWLDSPDTPWADDLACARDCVSFLGTEVRCSAGGWQENSEEEDPDAFVKVTADGEQTISWKTS